MISVSPNSVHNFSIQNYNKAMCHTLWFIFRVCTLNLTELTFVRKLILSRIYTSINFNRTSPSKKKPIAQYNEDTKISCEHVLTSGLLTCFGPLWKNITVTNWTSKPQLPFPTLIYQLDNVILDIKGRIQCLSFLQFLTLERLTFNFSEFNISDLISFSLASLTVKAKQI